MKNLTSISEHSDYLEKTFTFDAIKWDLHRKRVQFGKQPLELWMFTPCKLVDGVWVVLSNELQEGMTFNEIDKVNKEYQKAKERCLFEGFSVSIDDDENIILDFQIFEDDFLLSTDSQLFYDKENDQMMIECAYITNDWLDNIDQLSKLNLQLTPNVIKTLGLLNT